MKPPVDVAPDGALIGLGVGNYKDVAPTALRVFTARVGSFTLYGDPAIVNL